MQKAYFLLYLL